MSLATGTHLGPYEILEPLGAGGMGEVYRARDPRLSREVAVKLITTDATPSPDRLRRFETEARAAAQLSHPNVVTVHDVGTHDGQPYLVLELLEGETLREALRPGVPAVRQAVTWALEVSRGLAAAHDRGIVHRDLKPENVFVTTDGRVKILDFGLAKLHEPLVSDEADRESPTATKGTSPGVLLGTVGYMSPEQVTGETPDARTDVFALGTVLYEMVSGRRAFGNGTAPEVLASILRDEPPVLESVQHGVPATLETVVRRCLAKRRADRFSSGRALEAALETALVSLEPSRVSVSRVAETRGPYPGLSSFREADAERFFGREIEVEALWERLRRWRLVAVIGPSGAGKTSFVRAGLVPARPSGWGAMISTPGDAPMRSLAQALVEVLPSDADTMKQLLGFDDPDVAYSMVRRWRDTHLEAVLVVDQFEELFTLSPPGQQQRFAGLLGRLAKEADVHILLSLRDDFLMRCHEHETLVSVFEHLTPLGPLSSEGLRRALTEPARREDFSFEDETLVAEMLEAVEGARGALPLLAFAVARLWEKRDPEKKLLTRKAYEEIGGVAGALAQHAEQTLERIGLEREPIVLELFRNLVTSQWTRAVADREQLLSALPDAAVGAQVLDSLIDARLLTSYEVRESEPPSRHPGEGEDSVVDSGVETVAPDRRQRVEIVHESLLRAWPRLVRWQAQDEEGAVLRDQLKQAAHLWEEKGRPDDLLWTGTSEREFELWQDRYPGKLTAVEDGFARAMVHRAQRRKRVRRTAVTATIVLLLGVLTIIGGLWRRSVAETQRAEASKLLALGRVELETHPTAALAYARRSLELADSFEGRKFVLEILWRGPVARILPAAEAFGPGVGMLDALVLSPDGRWLAIWTRDNRIVVFPRDGGPTLALPHLPEGTTAVLGFVPRSDILIQGGPGESVLFWSLPELQQVRNVDLGARSLGLVRGDRLVTLTWETREDEHSVLREWPLPEGEPKVLGRTQGGWPLDIDPTGTRLARYRSGELRVGPLDGSGPERVLETGRGEVQQLTFAPAGDRLASIDGSDEIRLWSATAASRAPERILEGPRGSGRPSTPLLFSGDGSALVAGTGNGALYVWGLDGPPDAPPAVLRRPDEVNLFTAASDPSGPWLAASDGRSVAFWPLSSPRVLALDAHGVGYTLPFTADSRWLVSCSGRTRLWPLRSAEGSVRTLTEHCFLAVTHPTTPHVLQTGGGDVTLVPIEGGPPRTLPGRWEQGISAAPVAFDVQGHRAVAGPIKFRGGLEDPQQRVLRIWDLESGAEQAVSVADITDARWTGFDGGIEFAPDGSLFVGGGGGVRRLVLPDEPGGVVSSETVYAQTWARCDLSRDGRSLLVAGTLEGDYSSVGAQELLLLDLQDHTSRRITTHGERVRQAALDASGRIVVTADTDGVVRVGPATGEEPHLLLGATLPPTGLSVSPDGRWVATWNGEVIHLWPMPDVTKPPFHRLPYDELMAKLRAHTNLEVVEDEASPTGYTLEVGPFPGWENVPDW